MKPGAELEFDVRLRVYAVLMLVLGVKPGTEPGISVMLKPGANLELDVRLKASTVLMLVLKLKPDAGPDMCNDETRCRART